MDDERYTRVFAHVLGVCVRFEAVVDAVLHVFCSRPSVVLGILVFGVYICWLGDYSQNGLFIVQQY